MTYIGPVRAAAPSSTCSSSSAPGVPAAPHVAPRRRLPAAVALVVLIGTGCSNAPAETDGGGGGGAGPATTSRASAEPDPDEPGEAGGRGDENVAAKGSPDRPLRDKLTELARCMRENGVKDFPDPGADGSIQYYGDSSEFESAQEKCRDIVPEGGNG